MFIGTSARVVGLEGNSSVQREPLDSSCCCNAATTLFKLWIASTIRLEEFSLGSLMQILSFPTQNVILSSPMAQAYLFGSAISCVVESFVVGFQGGLGISIDF